MTLLLVMLLVVPGRAYSRADVPDTVGIWRLDCGSIDVDLSTFSDTGQYAGEKRTLVASCYLIRNGNQLLLWDTGLDGALAGKPKDGNGSVLKERLVPQLARAGVQPADVSFVGISHYHFDHVGQAADFPHATLLIGKRDLEVARSREDLRTRFAPWLKGGRKVEEVAGDKDVFGDGRVTMLSLPGHTPGHSALLVRLESGPVLLSGDQYHFREQVTNRGVPAFNADRADTLASHDRFNRLAKTLRARVVIQHDPRDVFKLPSISEATTSAEAKTEGKPRMHTSADILALKFLEGRWSGVAPDGSTFYEEYSFPNANTMQSRRYPDATFTRTTDGSTVSLEDGQIISRWGDYTWRADTIGDDLASFSPMNAPSAFTWRRLDENRVEVSQRWTDEKGAPKSYALILTRIPPTAAAAPRPR